jgi:hypothetical protein
MLSAQQAVNFDLVFQSISENYPGWIFIRPFFLLPPAAYGRRPTSTFKKGGLGIQGSENM